jgi:hypothetical protein
MKLHVASICFKFFRCFRSMLQVFHTDVAKVDWNVAVAVVVHCIRMLQASVPTVSSVFLDVCCKNAYLYVTYVSHICCKCFISMLRIFYNGF